MSDLHGVKVGDVLFISNRHGKWLRPVLRLTRTGRVITDIGEFNPGGWKRGETGWDHTKARLATDDDIAGINRAELIDKLRRFSWEKLNAETLKKVGEIVASHPQPE